MRISSAVVSLLVVLVAVALALKFQEQSTSPVATTKQPTATPTSHASPESPSPTPALTATPEMVVEREKLTGGLTVQDNGLIVEGDVSVQDSPSEETRKTAPPPWLIHHSSNVANKGWAWVYRPNKDKQYPIIHEPSFFCTESELSRELTYRSIALVTGDFDPYARLSITDDQLGHSINRSDYRLRVALSKNLDTQSVDALKSRLIKELKLRPQQIRLTLPPKEYDGTFRWIEGREV